MTMLRKLMKAGLSLLHIIHMSHPQHRLQQHRLQQHRPQHLMLTVEFTLKVVGVTMPLAEAYVRGQEGGQVV